MTNPPTGKTWFNKQEEATANSEGDILIKWGSFHFTTFKSQDDFLEYLEDCKNPDRQFFEVLKADTSQRMFADLDGEGLTITKEQLYETWEKLMKQVFKDVGLIFKKSNERILQSTGDKISAHWSMLGLSFKNCSEQKVFWQYVEHVIETDYPELCFMRSRADDKLELMNVLDLSVYGKNRPMRTIYSHKEDSDRVLMPVKVVKGAIRELQYSDPIDFLIHDPDAARTGEFYNIESIKEKMPNYKKPKKRFISHEDIEGIIKEKVPNTEIVESVGRMFKLKNTRMRVCIINGEENESDNSYVIWRHDGLYFGCHDSGCNGKLKKIHEFNRSSMTYADGIAKNRFDFGRGSMNESGINSAYTFQKFQNQFKEHRFESYDELTETMDQYLPRVIARVLEGKGSYIKKTTNGVDIVSNLGVSGFTMHYNNDEIVMKIRLDQYMNTLNGYGGYDCKLDHDECRPTDFNIWNGFQAERVDLSKCDVATLNGLELMKTFIFDVWASGDKDVYNYIISWFAGLFTNLKGINMVAMAMVAKQGTGKGFLLQFMKYLISGVNVCESQGIASITQKHNTAIQNKRLVVINEMSSTRDEFKSNFDKIKTYISDPVVQIEPKGINPYQINNISNFLLFTNHRDSIILEESDRRYAVFEMSDCHINDVAYFTMLQKACFNQDVADAFYTYLLDFEAVPVRNIPTTTLRTEMMTLSKSTPLKFLDAITTGEYDAFDEDLVETSARNLYEKFTAWCCQNGERVVSGTKFGTIISTILTKRRTERGIVYVLPVRV